MEWWRRREVGYHQLKESPGIRGSDFELICLGEHIFGNCIGGCGNRYSVSGLFLVSLF